MRTRDVIKFFGSHKAAAEALGLSRTAPYNWGELVPEGNAAQYHVVTRGRLKYDPAAYRDQRGAA